MNDLQTKNLEEMLMCSGPGLSLSVFSLTL
jgi:hypothetical protein